MRNSKLLSNLNFERIVLLDRHFSSIEKLWIEIAKQTKVNLDVLFVNSWRQALKDKDYKKILGYKKIDGNKTEYHLSLPDGWTRFGNRFFNKKIFKAFNDQNEKTLWSVNMPYYRCLVDKIDREKDFLIYQAVDDYSGYWPYKASTVKRNEKYIMNKADAILPVSVGLKQLFMKENPELKDKLIYTPNGTDEQFDIKYFYRTSRQRTQIGYLGSISKRVDWHIIETILKDWPNCDFNFYGYKPSGKEGKRMDELLENFRNLKFHGFVPQNRVPKILSTFDVAIIPEKKTQFNYMGSPQKLWNYLAVGMPLVSMDVPEQLQFKDVIYIADSPYSFSKAIEYAIKEIENRANDKITQRKKIARNHFWPKLAENFIKDLRHFEY